MKKYSLVAAPLLFYLTINNYANAQYAQSEKGVYKFSIALASSYTADTLIDEAFKKGRLYLNSINIRAVRGFMKRHRNVDNESWVIMENGGFSVKFNANGTNVTEYYNRHGNWTNSLKMYTEAQLSFKIRAMVKREYYDYNIAQIYEIESLRSNYKPTYIIRIEKEHSFVFIMIQDGEMGIWKELDKQQ